MNFGVCNEGYIFITNAQIKKIGWSDTLKVFGEQENKWSKHDNQGHMCMREENGCFINTYIVQ